MSIVPKTALQKSDDVKSVLRWKVDQINDNNLPIETLSDYIAQGLDGFDKDIDQIDNYITMLGEKKRELKEAKEKASIECAEFLSGEGLDRLEGIAISSITLTKPKEATIKEKLVFKTILTPKEINNFLDDNDLGSWVKERSEVSPKPAMIKINKRR